MLTAYSRCLSSLWVHPPKTSAPLKPAHGVSQARSSRILLMRALANQSPAVRIAPADKKHKILAEAQLQISSVTAEHRALSRLWCRIPRSSYVSQPIFFFIRGNPSHHFSRKKNLNSGRSLYSFPDSAAMPIFTCLLIPREVNPSLAITAILFVSPAYPLHPSVAAALTRTSVLAGTLDMHWS